MKKRITAVITGIMLCFLTAGCNTGQTNEAFIVSFIGESISVPFQQVEKDGFALRPTDPQRSGYTFDDWYLNGQAFDFDRTPIRQNTELTGKWNKNENPDEPENGGGEEMPDTKKNIEMLRDAKYQNGFQVSNYASNLGPGNIYLGEIHYNQPSAGSSQWNMAQWGSKQENLIRPDDIAAVSNGMYTYETAGKKFGVNPQTGEIYMEVISQNEYDAPRKDGEPWPHLLIEQSFGANGTRLSKMSALRIAMDFNILSSDNMMTSGYNSAMHAAQFQWYCTIQNLNIQSPDYGDTIWFGLQFYDNRTPRPGGSLTVDGGKEDSTGLAIYVPKYREFLDEPVAFGDEINLNVNILPMIEQALDDIRAYDGVEVFRNTDLSDLALTTMNLGWELPGTFHVKNTIKNLSINYDLK